MYNSLLQREYAEPVVFPNHQVERKAQRSPSLRLRFGRRSDPELVPHTAEKRWFDEVNQKPIRSPSLRLRFGRRSDPSMPMHSPLDILMNQAYENQLQHDLYEENMNEENEAALDNNEEDLYDTLMQAQKLRNLMLLLNKYGNKDNEEMAARSSLVAPLDRDVDEYERAIRKPGGPLRLRWGRSTGGASSMPDMALKDKNVLELKVSQSLIFCFVFFFKKIKIFLFFVYFFVL